jgi:hypothetical protein
MQQAAAKAGKARHKAKAQFEQFSLSELIDPATSRKRPQRAANVSFSAC